MDRPEWFVVVIIEPEFAPRDAFWVAGAALDRGPVLGAFIGVERMDTRGRPNAVVRHRGDEGIFAIGRGCRDGDRAKDAGGGGAVHDFVGFSREVWEGEMAVGVDHGRIIWGMGRPGLWAASWLAIAGRLLV